MAQATGPLQRSQRKLKMKLDGKDVYVVDLVNDDLDRMDEIMDEYAELEREKTTLGEKVDECEDDDERKGLRAEVRALTREQRKLDLQILGLYIEDKDGEPFSEEDLAKTPVRVQTALTTEASKKTYGTEGPTPGTSDER
jgi:hypothetical protein